jgi:hypothetical protein
MTMLLMKEPVNVNGVQILIVHRGQTTTTWTTTRYQGQADKRGKDEVMG